MRAKNLLIGMFSLAVLFTLGLDAVLADGANKAQKTAKRPEDNTLTQKAMFGAGCFWGVEEAFRQVKGVKATTVGYSGGDFKHPSYEDVCSGRTGHTETVLVEYDPAQVSYKDLLKVFWSCHDPTTLNRQGPDVGVQYRSVIFYLDKEQETAARESKQALDESGKLPRPVVTAIEPAKTFWPAEEYHQQYLEKRGLASCHIR